MSISRILIAVDFSTPATKAVRWASEYFARDTELVLLHVVELPSRASFSARHLPSNDVIEGLAREDAQRRMQAIAPFLTSAAVRRDVRVGRTYEQVAAVATEDNVDLVAIGPHGDRPRTASFLGTNADRIARTSPVSVLIASEPPPRAPQTILALVDDDDTRTRCVMTWARDLADRFDARVILLHVWSNAIYSHVASMAFATTHSDAEATASIEQEIHDAEKHWLGEFVRVTRVDRNRVTSVVKYGHAGETALEVALANGVDLIILGRHGSGLVAPALLGSTALAVLHGARCPVLVAVPREQ